MVPIKETFAQLTYNQLHPVSFSFFPPFKKKIKNLCNILKFCVEIFTACLSCRCFTGNASDEQLSIIWPMIRSRETIRIN